MNIEKLKKIIEDHLKMVFDVTNNYRNVVEQGRGESVIKCNNPNAMLCSRCFSNSSNATMMIEAISQ